MLKNKKLKNKNGLTFKDWARKADVPFLGPNYSIEPLYHKRYAAWSAGQDPAAYEENIWDKHESNYLIRVYDNVLGNTPFNCQSPLQGFDKKNGHYVDRLFYAGTEKELSNYIEKYIYVKLSPKTKQIKLFRLTEIT